MNRLRLDIDRLAVESFQPEEADAGRAQELFATHPAACDPFSVPPRCS